MDRRRGGRSTCRVRDVGDRTALGDVPWREALAVVSGGLHAATVATIGPHVDPAALGPHPANVHIERFVPQAHLLPLVRAVISHGGAGDRARPGVARLDPNRDPALRSTSGRTASPFATPAARNRRRAGTIAASRTSTRRCARCSPAQRSTTPPPVSPTRSPPCRTQLPPRSTSRCSPPAERHRHPTPTGRDQCSDVQAVPSDRPHRSTRR